MHPSTRRLPAAALALLVACVGDSPVAPPLGDAGGSDASNNPDASTVDGSGGDAALDAGPPRTGNFKWLFQLPKVTGFAMATGADGSTAVATTFGGSIQINGQTITAHVGYQDLLVFQLDPAGKLKWFKAFGLDGADMSASAVGISGNMVVVAGSFVPQDPGALTWSPTIYHKVTSDGTGNPGPFILGLDASQSGTTSWARSVVAAGLGEGECRSVTPGVVGTVAVGCSVPSGKISVTTTTDTYQADAAVLGSTVVEVVRVSDGSATDLEVIDSVSRVVTGLDADGQVYMAAIATASPVKFRRANTAATFDASKPNNVVAQLQSGGGAKWTHFWPRGLYDEGAPRFAFDAAKRPWVALPFTGATNPGGGVLTSQGLHDWSVLELAPIDGKIVTQKSFGGGVEDQVYDIAFDGPDLLLYGDGSNFTVGGASIATAPGQATRLALVKLEGASTQTAVWTKTAVESSRSADWSSTRLSVGGGMDVIGGLVNAQIEFTPTDVANGSPQSPVVFVAAFER